MFSPGESVLEFLRGFESGRPRGQDAQGRILIRRNLQEQTGIIEPVYLIKYQRRPFGLLLEEEFRITQLPPHGWQVAIEVFGTLDLVSKTRFTDSSDSREPDDAALSPQIMNLIQPERSFYHENVFYV